MMKMYGIGSSNATEPTKWIAFDFRPSTGFKLYLQVWSGEAGMSDLSVIENDRISYMVSC